MNRPLKALGRHLLIELHGCESADIANVGAVQKAMVQAAKATRAVIVDVVFHDFNPGGVSGVVVIAESHLAVHTWPEHACVSIDIYTCGNKVDPWKAYPLLKKSFKAKRMTVMELPRGLISSRRAKVY